MEENDVVVLDYSEMGTQEFILKIIEEMMPGSQNIQLYKNLFDSMSDEEFEQWINDLDEEKIRLALIQPHMYGPQLSVENNFRIGKMLGHKFFQRVWIPETDTSPAYLTTNPYLIVDLPCRRQAQLLDKKISIPEDNAHVDNFTGQPTGKSKGSKISYPEVQVLAALGLNVSTTEFMKFRGGDEKGFNVMNTMIERTGTASMKAAMPYSGTVKATFTLKQMLLCMHLNNTLDRK